MSEEKKYKKPSYSFKTEDQLLNFGQFEGQPIGEVMKSNSQYIKWCIKKVKGFKLWKKLAIRFEEIQNESKQQNIQ